jgi:hypothetical protein
MGAKAKPAPAPFSTGPALAILMDRLLRIEERLEALEKPKKTRKTA